jgi:hypothetical protein
MRSMRLSHRGICLLGTIAAVLSTAGCGSSSKKTATTQTQAVGGTESIGTGERAQLRRLALSGPVRIGTPTSLEAVRTTYGRYQQQFGGPPIHAGSIYAVEVHGKFKVPQGRTFRAAVLIVDARTNKRITGILLPVPRPLSPLGPVARL